MPPDDPVNTERDDGGMFEVPGNRLRELGNDARRVADLEAENERLREALERIAGRTTFQEGIDLDPLTPKPDFVSRTP